MRVLGISGSPRRGGNTDILLSEVIKGAVSKDAEVKVIILNSLRIAPCQNCEGCSQTGCCIVQDDMQMVFRELAEADRIVLASPLFFMGLTAQAKAMVDRCQSLWVKKYKLKQPPLEPRKVRKGLFVSVGGRKVPDLFEPAKATVKSLFKTLDIEYAGELLFPGIDEKGAIARYPDKLRQAFLTGEKLVEE